jgi:hypothetical protein
MLHVGRTRAVGVAIGVSPEKFLDGVVASVAEGTDHRRKSLSGSEVQQVLGESGLSRPSRNQ